MSVGASRMSKTGGPDLKKYLDKKLAFKLNGNRKVTGVLRGFDQFMNIVLDETIDEGSSDKNDIGLVVSTSAERRGREMCSDS